MFASATHTFPGVEKNTDQILAAFIGNPGIAKEIALLKTREDADRDFAFDSVEPFGHSNLFTVRLGFGSAVDAIFPITGVLQFDENGDSRVLFFFTAGRPLSQTQMFEWFVKTLGFVGKFFLKESA